MCIFIIWKYFLRFRKRDTASDCLRHPWVLVGANKRVKTIFFPVLLFLRFEKYIWIEHKSQQSRLLMNYKLGLFRIGPNWFWYIIEMQSFHTELTLSHVEISAGILFTARFINALDFKVNGEGLSWGHIFLIIPGRISDYFMKFVRFFNIFLFSLFTSLICLFI